jgi:TolB-like protein/lipopolysaccharide biosynthesis regulator YciM
VVLFALSVGGWRVRLLGRGASPRIESLAVLPLENFSRDPDQEYFADGMTEALITALSKISALKVISRTSVMQYKGVKKPLPQIARELNVDGVIEGSVQRSGNRVRITAQLIQAATDRHLWVESYERDLSNVLALESEVAQAIASEIRVKVTPQEKVQLTSARTVNPEAFQLYLQGRYYWNRRTAEGVKKAVEYMNQALAKDPNYALAYAGLADCYVILGDRQVIPGEEAYAKGMTAAQRALELDPTLAEPHAAIALLREGHDFDWAGAEAELKRAIELNPNYATAHQWYCLLLTDLGRLEEARQQIEIARGLDPLSLQIQVNVGEHYENIHDFDRAIEEYRKIVEMDPNFVSAHGVLAGVYVRKRMYREAAAEAQKFLLLINEREAAALYEGVTDEASYRRAVSRRIALLKERAKSRNVSPMTLAYLYVLLGDKEQAIAWLEKAYQEHDSGLRSLKTDPRYDPLRSDPRFQELLRRLHFPP